MVACLPPILRQSSRGQILVPVLVFGFVALLLITGLVQWGAFHLRLSQRTLARERALQVAEAGIEYYRWHLAHDPLDYQDGTGQPGPYTRDVVNKDGQVVGRYILEITPPPPGSAVVTLRSTGTVMGFSDVRRAIKVRLAVPSVARYAVVAHEALWFAAGTEVFGRVHSNGGIGFDGLAHNLVTSARASYKDPDHAGNDEFGVHTHVVPVDPPPPAPVPSRPDVFRAGRTFPVPAVDFDAIAGNLAQIKSDAQAGGSYFASSGAQGYHIVLKTNDTFDLWRVTRLVPIPTGCVEVLGQQGWGTWSIDEGGEEFIGNYAFPTNGAIFVEDHVWVNGQIDSARLTIASGKFPDNSAKWTNIIVNNDLRYTNTDGRDAIGLIAQGNVNVGLVSEDDLRIDGALIAQRRRVGRHYFPPPSQNQDRCSPYHLRQVITLFGMVGTYERFAFSYSDSTGYQTRNILYDPNLLYNPPPRFPSTENQFSTISWEEVPP